MRVERTDPPQFHECWLTTDEYKQLRQTTDSCRDDPAVGLGGGVGLRPFEISQIMSIHPRHESLRTTMGGTPDSRGDSLRLSHSSVAFLLVSPARNN